MKSTFKPDRPITVEEIGSKFDSNVYPTFVGDISINAALEGKFHVKRITFEITLEVQGAELVFDKQNTITIWGTTEISESTFKFILTKNEDIWEIELSEPESEVKDRPVAITSNEMTNIQPKYINVPKSGSVGNFGKAEAELAAGRLIRFFKETNSWRIFTQAEVKNFYIKNGWSFDNVFYGLLGQVPDGIDVIDPGDSYIVEKESGLAVTEAFIRNCYRNIRGSNT